MQIKSYQQKTYADWDIGTWSWVNRRKLKIQEKDLTLNLGINNGLKVFKFAGIKKRFPLEIFKFQGGADFIVREGVLNHFPRIWVKRSDLEEFIKEERENE